MSHETQMRSPVPKSVLIWMGLNIFMVFAMAVIGAVTRLTESGLSMVEWRPFIGALPPLSETEWNRVFDIYQQSPQYLQVNSWMTLADFKQIFFWEWFHRLWGRLIGVVFFVPFLVFWAKGWLPKKLLGRFFLLLALGVGQGFMGWYMVKSGLQDIAAVSQYRLAAHLGLALVVFFIEIWTLRDLQNLAGGASKTSLQVSLSLKWQAWVTLGFVALTICWGAFVAGLDAGKIFNSWPLMDGHFIPESLKNAAHPVLALHSETASVQFVHRWLAAVSFILVWALFLRARFLQMPKFITRWSMASAHMVVVQFLLGVSTLLMVVPVWLGALHQAGALVLLGLLACLLQAISSAKVK